MIIHKPYMMFVNSFGWRQAAKKNMATIVTMNRDVGATTAERRIRCK